jgi:LAO/AO transport system kinase
LSNPFNKQTAEFFSDGILNGDLSVLSKAITLVESSSQQHQIKAREILSHVMKATGKAFRLGVSGVPGVGKSTFIEAFGKEVIAHEHKLAVLAIDPSSSKSKGSILGDKTRMEQLSLSPGVFIRPSPSQGALGGTTRVTFETILLCEAAGFDYIIVETVGVGQSEIAVSSITDFFLLLMLAGAGDELQGIKRGITEMADALVITKADGDNKQQAKSAISEYAKALHLFPRSESGWVPPVLACSALSGEGISEIFTKVEQFRLLTTANGFLAANRRRQQKTIFKTALDEAILEKAYREKNLTEKIGSLPESEFQNPFDLAKRLLG